MDWTLAIFGWTACAVVAWAIAHVKGAPDEGMWGLLGLLFGPFGILGAIVVAKPGKTAETASVEATPLGAACPKCGQRRVSRYRRCQGCSADLGELGG